MRMTASADSIVQPLTVPETRQRMRDILPARAQAQGEALVNQALARLRLILKGSPALRECDVTSIYSCVIAAFGLKLEINSPLGHCYAIPFAGECKLVMGYRGLIELARRGGRIKAMTAEAVYEGDEFYAGLGTENRIVHRRVFTKEAVPLIAAYAVAWYDPDNYQFQVLQRHEIEKIRAVSKSGNHPKSPWTTFYERMAVKCPLKRLCKLIPQATDELAIALEHDDRYETGKNQDIPRIPLPDGTDLLPDGTPRSEASLSQKMKAGATEQSGSPEERLRREIEQLIGKLPANEREEAAGKVAQSLGLESIEGLAKATDVDKLVNAADWLGATLGEAVSPAPATTDTPPPAADDDIGF